MTAPVSVVEVEERLGAASLPAGPLRSMLATAIWRTCSTGRELIETGAHLARKTEAVAAMVRRNGVVNRLGELQGTARDYERLCSEFVVHREAADEIVRAYAHDGDNHLAMAAGQTVDRILGEAFGAMA